jgi:hypothetical protein
MATRTLAVAAAGFVAMVTVAAAVETKAPEAAPVEVLTYRPVTSDLMNAYIQPRHIKLFLAGTAQNWTFAEYERHNIGGALNRLLDTAIKAKDPAAFRVAYEGLTTGCNQCHVATGHDMVVMQSPATDSFPDQVCRAAGH